MASVFRADYDELTKIAGEFAREADRLRRPFDQIQRTVELLRGGDWVGQGAVAFFREMDTDVIPAMKQLPSALEAAGRTTKDIAQNTKDAEDEIARLFAAWLLGLGSAAGISGAVAGGGGGGTGTAAAGSRLADWLKSASTGLNIGSWSLTGLGGLASKVASRLNAGLASRLQEMASVFARGGEEALSSSGIDRIVARYMANSARASNFVNWLKRGSTGLDALGAGASALGQGMDSSAETMIGKITSGGAAGAFSWATRNNPYVFAADMVGMATGVDGPSVIMNSSFESIAVAGEGLITGSTGGMESLHQRQLNGDFGIVFREAAQAGDFWAKNGVVGGMSQFWGEVKGLF